MPDHPVPRPAHPQGPTDKGDSELVRLINETAALVRQNGGRLNWGEWISLFVNSLYPEIKPWTQSVVDNDFSKQALRGCNHLDFRNMCAISVSNVSARPAFLLRCGWFALRNITSPDRTSSQPTGLRSAIRRDASPPAGCGVARGQLSTRQGQARQPALSRLFMEPPGRLRAGWVLCHVPNYGHGYQKAREQKGRVSPASIRSVWVARGYSLNEPVCS
jgi:hypothetical protein